MSEITHPQNTGNGWRPGNKRWAVFLRDEQISKAHSTKHAAVIEAFERRLMILCKGKISKADGVEIRAFDMSATSRTSAADE